MKLIIANDALFKNCDSSSMNVLFLKSAMAVCANECLWEGHSYDNADRCFAISGILPKNETIDKSNNPFANRARKEFLSLIVKVRLLE
jgi:hypothetical protein